jgi:hypothetical protein
MENEKVASQLLGKTPDNIRMAQTALYQEFLADLDLIIRFYPLFEQRFKLTEKRTLKGQDEVYTKLRRLARLIRKEA